MHTTTPVRAHIRWMIRADMDEVLAIEQDAFPFCWVESDFLFHLRQKDRICMVALAGEKVVAFMVYQLRKKSLLLLNLGVHPALRRQGLGTQMVEKLRSKLSSHRRVAVTTDVRERAMPAQLFFRSQGFKALRVLPDCFEDTGEDGYRMTFGIDGTNPNQED